MGPVFGSESPEHTAFLPFLPILLWFFFFYIFIQIILIDSCTVRSCDFDVPMGGGELRVFLLCHLGQGFYDGILNPCDFS